MNFVGGTANWDRFRQRSFVFLHGLEPRSSEPESDVLPLHHRKIKLFEEILAGYHGANIKNECFTVKERTAII